MSRFIFHDDQNLRRGIARGRQNRLSWGVPIGRGKSRPLRWKLSKLPPFGCRSENGRGIAPRRDPSRATHLEAFRELWSGRPDEILGRRARVHHAGVHVPRRRPASDSTEVLSPLPWEVEDEGKNLRRFGGSLLGSLFGWTKPRPLGSASRKGCGGKRREPTAPSISRAPWVLECRETGTCGVFFCGHGFGDQKTDRLLLSFTAINSNRCTEHRVCTAANVCPK